jgi:dihydroflavonol-4-reductase
LQLLHECVQVATLIEKTTIVKRVIVTGASGHVGYHVARALCDHGILPILLSRTFNANIADLVQRGACARRVELTDRVVLVNELRGAECLFHLAGQNTTSREEPEFTVENTARLAEAVIGSAVDAEVKTIVYTSSVVVLGRSHDPNRPIVETDRTATYESPYVEGKCRAEMFCERLIREQGVDIRRVYPSWVVGPDDLRGTPPHQVVNKFLRRPQRFYFSGGLSIARAECVGRGHVAAYLRGAPGETYLLGGDNITVQQFFDLLADISHERRPSIRMPKYAIVGGASVLAALLKPLGKHPPIDPSYAKAVVGSYSWYDSSKAVRLLDYEIPPAKESLTAAVLGERQRLVGIYAVGKARKVEDPAVRSMAEERAPLLLTGAPGWLGNRFLEYYLHGIAGLPSPPRRRIRLLVEPRHAKLFDLPHPFEVVAADICDADAIGKALEGVGAVYHLAGAIYPPRISTLYRVNFEGTRNLVDQCVKKNVRRILFMATDSICGHGRRGARIFDDQTPESPYRHYGRSKWLAERYILDKSREGLIDGTSLRGFWFFGPGAPQRQLDFMNMMRWKRPIIFGNGKNFRSISHIDNLVAAFTTAETAKATFGKWYWIGDARPDYTVDDIYAMLCSGCKSDAKPVHLPRVICSAMRGVDTVLGWFGRLHPTIHGIGKFDFDIAGGIDAAQRDFGYRPVISMEQYASIAYRG